MARDDQRKERTPAIRIDFGKDQILSGMNLSGDGRLTFFDENGRPVSPKFTEIDSTYARPKGPKTLNRVVVDPNNIVVDQNKSLLRYKHVFAIDTNTSVVNGVRTSVTVAAYITNIKLGKPRWNAQLVQQNAFEFQNPTESSEKIGWCEFSALVARGGLDGPIAFIVDAHMGELKEINDRRHAICRGYFLPTGIEMIYASADAGGVEFIANSALAHCDKIGNLLMRLSAQASVQNFKPAPLGSPYSHSRLWIPPDDLSENWKLA